MGKWDNLNGEMTDVLLVQRHQELCKLKSVLVMRRWRGTGKICRRGRRKWGLRSTSE